MNKVKRTEIFISIILLLVFILPAAVFAGSETAVPEVLIEYGDYYTFDDALYVAEPKSDVISAHGTTIHAEDVTDEAVSVVVFDSKFRAKKYNVRVKKAKLSFALIDGQSNADGSWGIRDKKPTVPPPGCAYIWINDKMIELNNALSSEKRTEGFYPAIAAEWYKLTGEKTLFLNVARAGMPIEKWYSGEYAEQTVEMVKKVISAIDQSKFELMRTGYYWLQGEADSDMDTDSYEKALESVHNDYIAALSKPELPAPYGGILTVRSVRDFYGYDLSFISEYNGPRAAQQALADKYDDLYMASVVTDSWSRRSSEPYAFMSDMGITVSGSDTRYLFDVLHYSQSAYDMMGLEAADSIYKGHIRGDQLTDFSVVGYDAVTVYPERATICVEDNERYDQRNNADINSAQITVIPSPFYGKCSGLSMVLTDEDGQIQGGLMDDSGWIPDYTRLSKPLRLTVTVNGISKKYILSRKGFPEIELEPDKQDPEHDTDKQDEKTEPDKQEEKEETVIQKSYFKITVNKKQFKARANGKTTFKARTLYTVKNKKSKITYSKAKGIKMITVSKNGNITVAKGLKRGRVYKVRVKAVSAATNHYESCTRTVTVKIRIK